MVGTAPAPFVEGLEVESALSLLGEEEPGVSPEAPPEIPSEAPPAVPPEIPPEAPPEAVPPIAVMPGTEAVQEPSLPLPDASQVPIPEVPAAPLPHPKVKEPASVEAISGIERLVKLANRLDEDGKIAEADAVDKLIRITAEKAGP